MKISLFQGILLAVFSFAALIGIFVFATHTSNSSSTNTAIGTVVIWGTLPKADLQQALTTLAQTDTTLSGVSYVQKNEHELATDLAGAIATGAAPDLVLTSQEQLQSLTKLLTPIPSATLSAAAFTSAFIGESRLLQVPDGSGYWGLPLVVDPLVLFSNSSILASNGIATPPTTWESLTGLVPVVANLTSTKQITRGLIALGTYDNVHDARGILSALFLQVGVPISLYRNGILSVDLSGSSSSGVGIGQAALDFYAQFADPSKLSYTWNASLPDSQKAFLSGNLALYLGYASEAHFLRSANPNLDFRVTALPQPATAADKSTYGLLYTLMIPRGAKNPSGAFAAASLFTNRAGQTAFANATGLAPVTLTMLATTPDDPVAAVAAAEALYARGWLSPAPEDTDAIFSSMITSVISGRLNTLTALTTGASALSILLQK